MIACDIRIKELKKQGYISGVMAGKRIRERMKVLPDVNRYDWNKLYKYLMDNAKKYVMAEPVDVCGTIRWYYDENDLLNWIEKMLSYRNGLVTSFLKDKDGKEK